MEGKRTGRRPKRTGTWQENEAPTREQIVAAIRTLASLGSCWLDRDPDIRGSDDAQQRVLAEVVKLLAKVPGKQVKHAQQVIAATVRDEVMIAMDDDPASHVDPDSLENGNLFLRRNTERPAQLRPDWGGRPREEGEDRLRIAIRNASENAGALLPGVAPRLTAKEKEDVLKRAQSNLSEATAPLWDAKRSPQEAASTIALQLVGLTTARAADNDDSQINRLLDNVRHPDQGKGQGAVDSGEYFGARRSKPQFPGEPNPANPRAAAAAALLSEAAGGKGALAWQIERASPPHLWTLAARGVVLERPTVVIPNQWLDRAKELEGQEPPAVIDISPWRDRGE